MTTLTIEEGYAFAIKKLAVSDCSSQEMLLALKRRGCGDKDARVIVGRLLDLKYINDEKLCARLCEAWRQNGLYGKKALTAKLLKRKLPARLIEDNIAAADVDESDKAKCALKIYLGKIKKPDETTWIKALRYLAARGFSYDTARQAVKDSIRLYL